MIAEYRLLQPSSTFRSKPVVVLMAAAVFAAIVGAQAPRDSQSDSRSSRPDSSRTFPVPTNLRVLPKDFTGWQVHDVMEQWSSSLGARCDACHAEDTESTAPNEKPRLDFADDSKPMKAVARVMYTMTAEINSNYIAQVKGSAANVTCGTCHHGAVNIEPFTAQPAVAPPPAEATRSAKEFRQPK